MTDFQAQLLDIQRTLDAATARANTHTDPNLSPEGQRARRAEMIATARQAAAPQVAAVLADATREAASLAERAAGLLPRLGTDADSTAQATMKWSQVQMLLSAGMPLRDVLASADVATALSIREFGPSFEVARAYKAPGLGESMTALPVPDHGPLHRSIDARLAQLSGLNATNAIAAAHEAAAVAAGVKVTARYLAGVIAGTPTGTNAVSASVEAHYAELAAREGLAADTATGDAQDGGA